MSLYLTHFVVLAAVAGEREYTPAQVCWLFTGFVEAEDRPVDVCSEFGISRIYIVHAVNYGIEQSDGKSLLPNQL